MTTAISRYNYRLKVWELHYEAIKHVDKKVDEVDTKVEDVKADLELLVHINS